MKIHRHATTRSVLIIDRSDKRSWQIPGFPGSAGEPVVVRDLDAALRLLDAGSFQAVLLHPAFPGKMPMEVVEQVLSQAKRAPVLLLLADPDLALERKALEAGVQDILFLDNLQAETLERSLRFAQIRSTRSDQHALTPLLGRISHEMRTPLSAMLSLAGLLRETSLTERQRSMVAAIELSGETLTGILSDLLAWSASRAERYAFDPRPFSLHALADHLAEAMSFKAKDRGLSLEFFLDDQLPDLLVGDKLRLNQILYNLISNAIKFTATGGIEVAFTRIRPSEEALWMRLRVSDTGIGIPAGEQPYVFEPYVRGAHPEKVYEGIGLGLAVVRSLVEGQGGRIWLESEEGQGSHFFVEIPFGWQEAKTYEEVQGKKQLEEPSFSLLLAEDHAINRRAIRAILEKRWKNIRIQEAGNGQVALELLSKQDFDLVLMDIQMPQLDGQEVLNRLRQADAFRLRRITVVAITADEEAALKPQEPLFDEYILKPVDPMELTEKVAALLKKAIPYG